MNLRSNIIFSIAIIFVLTFTAFAQNKKNSRPSDEEINKKITSKASTIDAKTPVYFYEFSKPEFIVSKILIEHDEKGLGKITFQKNDSDNNITEPLELSEKTLTKLKELWTELNFLDSTESYQSAERDYGHLGTIKVRMKKDSKDRTEIFNWTENATAKSLADEYRKIGNQFVWEFDINVARENQPLESPKIMKRLDSYLKRNEISDPRQMLPFLKELSDDERVPLITRNHAERLMKNIEKTKEIKTDPK